MKTSSKRGMNFMKDWPVGKTPSTPDPIWFYGLLSVGIVVGFLVFVVDSLFDSSPVGREIVVQEPAASFVMANFTTKPVIQNAQPAEVRTSENELPNVGERNESITIAPPARFPEETIAPIIAPIPSPPLMTSTRPSEPLRKISTEAELLRQLRDMPEFGLKASTRDNMVETYKSSYQSNTAMGRRPTFDASTLLKHMPTAQQLPLRSFPGCQLNPFIAVSLGTHSRALRAYLDILAPKDATGKRVDPKQLRSALRQERRGKPPSWLKPEAIPAMVQILSAEDVPLRLILVDMLADIPGKVASTRLAQRAVFDLSPKVREAAIDALRQRPQRESRRTLVDAMQHPWPVAADQAADALIALNDRDAAPLLVAQLDKPSPTAPFATKTGHSVREVVRVNHQQNCLLCHVPAVGRDPVTDIDPFAQRPSQTYRVGSYSGPQLPGGSGNGAWANKVLIRADVQFLRQDFSITFPTGSNTNSNLRFDFLVRTRPTQPDELQKWKDTKKPEFATYPQRESILYALRKITGQDAGPTTDAWVELYPHARAEAEGVRMANALRVAMPEQRELLLAKYRDSKESHNTEGLAHAIPHVSTKLQEKVRNALVDRMARLSADDLRGYLDEDGELRVAASRACIRKADPTFIPELISLLTEEGDVAGAASQALKKLTNEDFGPKPGCSPEERESAVAQWHAWHTQQGS